MLRWIEGAGVLLLLSVFFSYVLAPLVPRVRKRIRLGKRQRPISDGAAIVLIYFCLFLPAAVAWRLSNEGVRHWFEVTAPASIDRLFSRESIRPFEAAMAHAPLPESFRQWLVGSVTSTAAFLERHTRETLDEAIAAARHSAWLIVAPVIAFFLLTAAPAFQRSALRVLPRGHLQWRFEEYLRDVNSALAGYVRAQGAAGVIVGAACIAGFLLIGLPSAISLGVLAGVLELVPAIGPLTMLIIATAQGERIVAVILFLLVLRVVQDYVVYPQLVKSGMHLSTTAVIVTIWIGAAIAGAGGVVLALPAAGCLSVSLRHWREYREIERLLEGGG